MSSILEGELASIISEALIDADVPYPVTITRTVPGGPGPNPWDPPIDPVITDYVGQGFVEAYRADEIDGTLILATDLRIIVLLPTLAITPAVSDTVTVRGATYSLISVSPDPALATAALQARA